MSTGFQAKSCSSQPAYLHRLARKYILPVASIDNGWGQKAKTICFFFVEIVMLHIELMGMEQITPCKHICSYSHPRSLVGGSFWFTKSSHVA